MSIILWACNRTASVSLHSFLNITSYFIVLAGASTSAEPIQIPRASSGENPKPTGDGGGKEDQGQPRNAE